MSRVQAWGKVYLVGGFKAWELLGVQLCSMDLVLRVHSFGFSNLGFEISLRP